MGINAHTQALPTLLVRRRRGYCLSLLRRSAPLPLGLSPSLDRGPTDRRPTRTVPSEPLSSSPSTPGHPWPERPPATSSPHACAHAHARTTLELPLDVGLARSLRSPASRREPPSGCRARPPR